MTKKKQAAERISWSDYQQILQAERDRWVKLYGNQRSRRLSFSKRTNAQRVSATHLDNIPLDAIEKTLMAYQARNPIARFFIRLFTNIEKKQTLYHYQTTINALDNLLSMKKAPINQAELQKSFFQLNQHASSLSGFSRLSKLQKRLLRQLKKNEIEPSKSAEFIDTPVDTTSSTTDILSQLNSSDTLTMDQPTPLKSTTTEGLVSTPLQSTSIVIDETKVKKFNQQFEQDKIGFEQIIGKEKIALRAFVRECRQSYLHDAAQVSIETQSALAETNNVLKKAYHKLSLLYHPDKIIDGSIKYLAEKAFKEISILYTNGITELGNIVTEQINPKFTHLYKETEELKAGVAALQKRLQKIEIDMEELSKGFKSIIEINEKFIEQIKELSESNRKIEQGQKELNTKLNTMESICDDIEGKVKCLMSDRETLTVKNPPNLVF